MGLEFLNTMHARPAIAWLVGIMLSGGPISVAAEEMTFRLTNHVRSPVWVEFHSRDRLKRWPDDGRLFILADSSPKRFTVPCSPGEQICYGAWIEGQVTESWGAGYNRRVDCDDCCHICEIESESPLYQVSFR